MTENNDRLAALMGDVDAANAQDPRLTLVGGGEQPYEQVYSRRMLEALKELYPDASERLTIAAYAQHIRRWDIPRTDYPDGRDGYNKWRRSARQHHVDLISTIMEKHGYDVEDIEHVSRFIKKEQLKKDKDSQALENIVAIVFLEHYFEEFASDHGDYEDDKLVDILGKTLKKMSPKGHEAALARPLSDRTRRLTQKAIEKEKDALARLAEVAID